MSSCYRYCRVYKTLKQSRLRFKTIRKCMPDLTTVNSSICLATFVVFVGSELVLGLISRVVILRLRIKARSIELRFCQKCKNSRDFKNLLWNLLDAPKKPYYQKYLCYHYFQSCRNCHDYCDQYCREIAYTMAST